jgi:very-long-chain (3R)-3-hydroxyacyl-CoA dehydratase
MHLCLPWVDPGSYSFFYILYPIGAFSEWQLLTDSMIFIKSFNKNFFYAYVAISFAYAPGFLVMLSHMVKQREKYLSPQAKAKKNN